MSKREFPAEFDSELEHEDLQAFLVGTATPEQELRVVLMMQRCGSATEQDVQRSLKRLEQQHFRQSWRRWFQKQMERVLGSERIS